MKALTLKNTVFFRKGIDKQPIMWYHATVLTVIVQLRGGDRVFQIDPLSRIPIYEQIAEQTEKLKAFALEEGMVTLKEAGMIKVRAGLTSLQAAFEVTGGE